MDDLQFRPRLERLRNQHDLLTSILRQAGAVDADSMVPKGLPGRIADVVFKAERLIVEVKSLTTDRRTSPLVQERLGGIVQQGAAFGGPVIFGTVNVRFDHLPPKTGARAIREVGDRVLKEVRAADKQIAATAEKLGWDTYRGGIAFVAPPAIMRRDVIGWLVNDALAPGKYPGLNWLVLASTPFLGTGQADCDSYLTMHGRDGYDPGLSLRRRIGSAWGKTHPGRYHEISPDELDELTKG